MAGMGNNSLQKPTQKRQICPGRNLLRTLLKNYEKAHQPTQTGSFRGYREQPCSGKGGTWASIFGRVFDAPIVMKKSGIFLLLALVFVAHSLQAQPMSFRKGVVTDSVIVGDSIPETFALYLPLKFETTASWPVLFVFDMQGKGSQALAMFREASEQKGYILVASNNTNDSLSIADNILVTDRMIRRVYSLFPIEKLRMYTAGKGSAAMMAALVPSFIKEVAGVISLGADIPNTEILNEKNPFYFVGMVGLGDYHYTDMIQSRDLLNQKKIPNNLFFFEGEEEWPDADYRSMAVDLLSLHAIKKGLAGPNDSLIRRSYQKWMGLVEKQLLARRLFLAHNTLEEIYSIYQPLLDVDSLRNKMKQLKKDKLYRTQRRNENNVLLQEALIREDFLYYLEEDILTYNFNNLGWWNFQMEELSKYGKSGKWAEKYMGQRLEGYLNALIEDHIDLLLEADDRDEEALLLLWMLKTITAPGEYGNYLKIISMSSKYEDYGTALFYLEELLKNGYTDRDELYNLDHTALLRITPEYNAIIGKYLKDARYEIIQE